MRVGHICLWGPYACGAPGQVYIGPMDITDTWNVSIYIHFSDKNTTVPHFEISHRECVVWSWSFMRYPKESLTIPFRSKKKCQV